MGVILGLFFVGLGYLVKANPGLIAGYNTMSDAKKKNVDIEGLSAFMKKGLIMIGILIIAAYGLLNLLNLDAFFSMALLPIILGGTGYMVLKSQKYDHNKGKNSYLIIGIMVIVLLVTTTMTVMSYLPTKAVFKEDKIDFTGSYGTELMRSEIQSVVLLDSIPAIQLRNNGVSVGSIKKGSFKLESWGSTYLLLNSLDAPFLVIQRKNGKRLVFNGKTGADTEAVYQKLK